MGLARSDGAVPLRIGAMDPTLGCTIAAAPAAPTQCWPTCWLCPSCSGAGRKRLWGENRQNSEQRWDLQVRGLGCILRGARLGPAGARQRAALRGQPDHPPSSFPAWQGTRPSRRVPGQAGHGVGQGGCIQLGFTARRPRERPRGPIPGEPRPGKSPAAGARHPPHRPPRLLQRHLHPGVKSRCLGIPNPDSTQSPQPCIRGPLGPSCWLQGRVQCPTGTSRAFPSRQEPGCPAAGPGKISVVLGNLLTCEKRVLEIKPHPRCRGQRAGGRAMPSAGGWRARAAVVLLLSNTLLITAWISHSMILPGSMLGWRPIIN